MPIYIYRCPEGHEVELIESLAEGALPHVCACSAPMSRAPTAASFGFKTAGGNFAWFSGAHGPVTRGNRRPRTISTGHGLGGRRAPPSPKRDPEFRARLVREFAQKGAKP